MEERVKTVVKYVDLYDIHQIVNKYDRYFFGQLQETFDYGGYIKKLIRLSNNRFASIGYKSPCLKINTDITFNYDRVIDDILILPTQKIVVSFRGGNMYILNECTYEIEITIYTISSTISITINGKICARDDRYMKIWNPSTGQCEKTIDHSGRLLPDNRVMSCNGSNMTVWDEKESFTLKNIYSPIILTDGRIASLHSYYVEIWDLNTKTCQFKFIEHNDIITHCVELNNTLVTIDSRSIMKIWDLNPHGSGECLKTIILMEPNISLIQSIDDNKILLCSIRGNILIYNEILEKKMNTDRVILVIQLDDGRLVTASTDQNIRIWF